VEKIELLTTETIEKKRIFGAKRKTRRTKIIQKLPERLYEQSLKRRNRKLRGRISA